MDLDILAPLDSLNPSSTTKQHGKDDLGLGVVTVGDVLICDVREAAKNERELKYERIIANASTLVGVIVDVMGIGVYLDGGNSVCRPQ